MGRQRKYLESTTQAALLLCCVGLLSACGSDDLERDEAATMIEEKIGKAVANTVPVDKGAIESWGQRLEFTHSANGMLSGNYILDSVVPEVAQIDAGPLMVVLKAPVHYKIVVTGITAPSPESNERIVEYSVTQENVPVIVRLLSRKDWRGKIKFAKYDDGWRIGESLGATFGGPVLESELTPAERAEIDSMILAVDQRRAAQQREREEVAKAAEAARRAFDARMHAARTTNKTLGSYTFDEFSFLGGKKRVKVTITDAGVNITGSASQGNLHLLFAKFDREYSGIGYDNNDNLTIGDVHFNTGRDVRKSEEHRVLVKAIREAFGSWKAAHSTLVAECAQRQDARAVGCGWDIN